MTLALASRRLSIWLLSGFLGPAVIAAQSGSLWSSCEQKTAKEVLKMGWGGWLRSRQDAGCRTGLSVTCEQNIVNKMQLDSGTGRQSSSVSGLLTCGAFVLIAVAFNYSSLQLPSFSRLHCIFPIPISTPIPVSHFSRKFSSNQAKSCAAKLLIKIKNIWSTLAARLWQVFGYAGHKPTLFIESVCADWPITINPNCTSSK